MERNNIPPYAEEYILKQDQEIQTDLRASDILKIKTPIPSEFVKMEIVEGNHVGSTNHKWTKPLSERYLFLYKGEEIQLDIPHYIMQKLGLLREKDITFPFYLNSKVLDRKPERGGITIEDEKEIIIEKSLVELEEEENRKKGKKFVSLEKELDEQLLEIERLSKIISKIKEENRLTTTNENKIKEKEEIIQIKSNKIKEVEEVLTNLQHQFNGLQNERNEIQQTANNLESELHRFQGGILGSLFRNFKKSTRKVKDLKARIVRLGAELFDKDRQIEKLNNQIHQLTTQQDNLQNQVNNLSNQVNSLNGTVGNRDQAITDLNNQIVNLNRNVNTWKNNYDNRQKEYESTQSNYNYYYSRYCDKDREVDKLCDKITSLNSQISSLESENSRLWGKSIDNYQQNTVLILREIDVYYPSRNNRVASNITVSNDNVNYHKLMDGLSEVNIRTEKRKVAIIEYLGDRRVNNN